MKKNPRLSPIQIDLLPTHPSKRSFEERLKALNLSSGLEKKVLACLRDRSLQQEQTPRQPISIESEIEKELGTEVLLRRHAFTECLLSSSIYRQAAISVIQNIYLFQNRKIFFSSELSSTELERQEALNIFSDVETHSVPLAYSLQHLILARIWQRISRSTARLQDFSKSSINIHKIVVELNTLRNVYMLLATGLVSSVANRYSQASDSFTHQDAVQIGLLGVARASYRYHHSCGVRFSTFSFNWIINEIHRQTLTGQLIRGGNQLTPSFDENETPLPSPLSVWNNTETLIEEKQLTTLLLDLIDSHLSPLNADILKRRYGLGPYRLMEQSVIEIATMLGKTRSSIYQREKVALRTIRQHLSQELEHCFRS